MKLATKLLTLVLSLIGTVAAFAKDPPMLSGSIHLKSASAIAFNADGILFIADPIGSSLYAVATKSMAPAGVQNQIDIQGIDKEFAALLGARPEEIVIEDMAIHPVTREIYLSVTRKGTNRQSLVFKIGADSQPALIDLKDVNYYKVALNNIPDPDKVLPWGQPLVSLAVTDLAFIDGELWVAGLSGEEFTSKLRRYKYPLSGSMTMSQVEIFHTSHDKYETESPIESFLPISLSGTPTLLAAYGCSPLAKFSISDLKSKQQVRGQTLAELGGGNRPLDMIELTKNGEDFIIIANSHRTLMKIRKSDLENAPPMTKGVPAAYMSGGVPYVSIAEVGILHLEKLSDSYLLAVKRNLDSGSLDLVSLDTKWY